jgi:hypothetical protein
VAAIKNLDPYGTLEVTPAAPTVDGDPQVAIKANSLSDAQRVYNQVQAANRFKGAWDQTSQIPDPQARLDAQRGIVSQMNQSLQGAPGFDDHESAAKLLNLQSSELKSASTGLNNEISRLGAR